MNQTAVETSTQAPSSRGILRDLLLGCCIGALGVALVWRYFPGPWQEPEVSAQELALQRRHVLQQEAQLAAARAALATSAQPVARTSPCTMEAMIPPAGEGDGHVAVEHPFPGGARDKAKVFLRAAHVAAEQGRRRDAEVALLAACRENERATSGPAVPLAHVLGVLGQYYVASAAEPAHADLREQLLARAREVLGSSARGYAEALGPNASRAREASRRLAALDGGAVAATNASAPPVRSATALAARPVASRAERGPELHPARAPALVAGAGAGASDPELQQLASDIARLRAQVESVSRDPDGLRRRTEAAAAQRDRCRDPACLQAWYRGRRQQLLAEF